MRPLSRTVTISCWGLLLTGCGLVSGGGPDYDETDRQSRTLADAISYPRHADADGFARAALATSLGQTPSFSLLEVTDLPHKLPDEPMARLVWRIHNDAYDNGWKQEPAFDACYRVEFDYYGPSSGPDRIDCPADATPVSPPPTASHAIPPEAGAALQATLAALPATPAEADVRAAVTAGQPAPKVNEETGLAAVPPEIRVHVTGSDVGVALFARDGVDSKDCVLGRRVAGEVAVWSLNWRDLQLKEMSCDPETALAGH